MLPHVAYLALLVMFAALPATVLHAAGDPGTILKRHKAISTKFDKALTRVLEQRALDQPIAINRAAKSGEVALYVVRFDESIDYKKLYADLFPEYPVSEAARDALTDNALAYEGTVLLGELYLSQIFISAYNGFIGEIQALQHGNAPRFDAIAAALRYLNLDYKALASTKKGNSVAGRAGVIANGHAVGDAFGSFETSHPAHKTSTAALLPLLAHEVAHVQLNVKLAGFNEIRAAVIAAMRAEEDRADQISNAAVSRYMDRVTKSGEPVDRAMAVVGLRSFALLMRDTLLIEATRDERFNAFSTRDLYVELLYNNCTDDEAKAKLDPLHPERVASGRMKPLEDMVLLSDDDYGELRKRLVADPSSRTHSHNFQRAKPIFELLAREDERYKSDLESFQHLKSILDDRQQTPSNSDLLTFAKTPPELEALFANGYEFHDAAWCPLAVCRIGTPRSGSSYVGFVEIVGAPDATYRMTWYTPIGEGLGRGKEEFYISQLVFMMSVLTSLTGKIEPITQLSETVRRNTIGCGAGTGLWESDEQDYFIYGTSLSKPDWMVLQINSKKLLDQESGAEEAPARN